MYRPDLSGADTGVVNGNGDQIFNMSAISLLVFIRLQEDGEFDYRHSRNLVVIGQNDVLPMAEGLL
jgi:hypothetical protein